MTSLSIMLLLALFFIQTILSSADNKAWSGLPKIPKIVCRTRNWVGKSHSRISADLTWHSSISILSSRGGGQDGYYDSYDGRGRHDYDDQPGYNEEDNYYEQEYNRKPYPKKESLSSAFSNKLPSQRKLGTGCIAAGSVLMLLGVSLFFNKTLLRFGNILLLVGVPLMFGPSKTMGYFLQPAKVRATACLVVGIILVVLMGRPILGIAMQVFGLLNLFGNMFPMIRLLLSQMPVVGDMFKGSGEKKSSRTDKQYYDKRDSYYDDSYEESYY